MIIHVLSVDSMAYMGRVMTSSNLANVIPLVSHKKPFKCLGYDSGIYYLISNQQLQVLAFKATDLKKNNLLQLAPLTWWSDKYPSFNAEGEIRKSPDWDNAIDDIIQNCSKAGVYAPELIRGRGFWRDGKTIIRHNGESLTDIRTSNTISMLDSSLKGVYQRSRTQNLPSVNIATDEQIVTFIDVTQRIYWSHESHAALLAGWIALAPLCGLLEWRPHIWISGEHGCGKSDTALNCISVCVGKKQLLHTKDSTTQAGLRQTLKADAIPVALDEMEPNSNKDRGRIDQILSLARNASSDDEAVTLKGSITGDSTSYRVRSMFCYASINTHLPELADQSRTAILDIEKRAQTEQSKADFDFIKKALERLDNENFGYSLTELMINRIDTLKANITTFIECAGDVLGSARDGKQYGSLLAGYVTILSSEPISKNDAIQYLNNIQITRAVAENRDTDATGWSECWAKIASITLDMRDSRSRVTVAEAIDILRDNNSHELALIAGINVSENEEDKNKAITAKAAKQGQKELETALRKMGIIYQNGKEALYGCAGEGIYLANKSELLKKALSGTSFESWTQFSKRAGEDLNKPIKLNGTATRFRFIKM